ncbi:hypothetical protein Nhal_1983 [Nitrosococcus halophilus Nc 4]|uniref:Uncharacterized protein n=1 Tax=Nitrosococcus halophilus (strain Nc4) TaxID=472759 RepID=D5C3W9_NITHN|nr:hypothetical protein Nhal_1983 [Nitrosococcus halophilus Nc 4]
MPDDSLEEGCLESWLDGNNKDEVFVGELLLWIKHKEKRKGVVGGGLGGSKYPPLGGGLTYP